MALENANSGSVVLSKYSPLHEIQVSSASSSAEKEKTFFATIGVKSVGTPFPPQTVLNFEKNGRRRVLNSPHSIYNNPNMTPRL